MRARVRSAWVIAAVACLAARAGAQVKGNPIVITTGDSVRIAAAWFDTKLAGAPAVILVHGVGENRFAWEPLWDYLTRAGIDVLALDLRGHGASRRLAPEIYDRQVKHDQTAYQSMIYDVDAGVRFLTREHRVPPGKIVLIGADLGSSLGLQEMSRNPRLRGMIALSPGQNYFGIPTLEHIKKYGKRPLYIIAMKQEMLDGPQQIVDTLRGNPGVKLEMLPRLQGRGTDILGQPLQIEKHIMDWLREVLKLKPA